MGRLFYMLFINNFADLKLFLGLNLSFIKWSPYKCSVVSLCNDYENVKKEVI